ncbi:hypothetical protein PHMEG_00016099 [Phytophthora megakarya]|uniref:Uncharacterized protein n=1 Tax=Phytophthora megakarya TaxID=4795 RepID=A0A225VZT8_9STRA|nr:hypothetical protein PHMEG_00016099 [Phytophthora megakarya]
MLEGGVVAPEVSDPSTAEVSDVGWSTKTPGSKGGARQKTRNDGVSPILRSDNTGKATNSKSTKQRQRTAKPSFPLKGKRPQGENGDGHASFYKLQELLRSEAPPEYIFQMVVRIHDLAMQRRLGEFESRINEMKDEEEKQKRWDNTICDDKLRLARTVYSWLIQD